MTNEEIKILADGYYAGNADWLNKEQEQDTKVGWRQGFAYALRQFAVSGRLSQQSEIVRQRLHYHFAKVGGGWNIEGMSAPFMKEFLNEVQKLVDLSK